MQFLPDTAKPHPSQQSIPTIPFSYEAKQISSGTPTYPIAVKVVSYISAATNIEVHVNWKQKELQRKMKGIHQYY